MVMDPVLGISLSIYFLLLVNVCLLPKFNPISGIDNPSHGKVRSFCKSHELVLNRQRQNGLRVRASGLLSEKYGGDISDSREMVCFQLML